MYDAHLSPVSVVLFDTVAYRQYQLIVDGHVQRFTLSVHQPGEVAESAHRVDPVDSDGSLKLIKKLATNSLTIFFS